MLLDQMAFAMLSGAAVLTAIWLALDPDGFDDEEEESP